MSSSASKLFTPFRLGSIELSSRVVMSPMTRSRSPESIPNELVATYYGQRANAGLIITEGTSPSPNGLGYARIPGLFNEAQVAGWKKTTDAVHKAGGHIFVQLMHTGRVSHPDNLPAGAKVLGPSAVTTPGTMWTDKSGGMQPYPEPQVMTDAEIETAISEFGHAAKLAIAAGFDGVEMHGANGYLIEQFLNTASNKRTDKWGGSVENRIRFALAAIDAAVAAAGKDRVGIRLSPYGVFNGSEADPATDDVYKTLAAELHTRGIAYVHLIDHSAMGAPKPKAEIYDIIRGAFKGTVIRAGGFDRDSAEAMLASGKAELIAFGRPYLANPNLVDAMKRGAKLNEADMTTAYTPGPKGYTDYPAV